MHHRPVIIRHAGVLYIPRPPRRQQKRVARGHVIGVNGHVTVPIWPVVFMDETESMADLMDRFPKLGMKR